MNYGPTLNVKIKQFKNSYNLNTFTNDELFELFSNRCLLESYQNNCIKRKPSILNATSVGGGDDMGIDGIFVCVNNQIISSVDEVKSIIDYNSKLNIEFVFIQSKNQDKFDCGDLGKSLDGILDFLNEKHNEPMNDRIKDLLEIKDFLFNDEVMIYWESAPLVSCYYIINGELRENRHFEGKIANFKESIVNLNNYSGINFKLMGAKELLSLCDNIDNCVKVVMNTLGNIEFEEVLGVENSLIVLCGADEFLKILTTEDGLLRSTFFEDNIRDYQGKTSINEEIMETLKNDPSSFLLKNNGITIVCSSINSGNRKITIENPQIVNGCQTSNVLYLAHRNNVDLSKVTLAIKVIATKDDQIINSIVKGTNSQNELSYCSFETIRKFHKDFEEFVNSIQNDFEKFDDKIFYERRSRQYSRDLTIKECRVFSLETLTRATISIFYKCPHDTVKHISRILEKYQNLIYIEGHSFYLYYLSALMLLNFERYLQDGLIEPKYDKFKYQILYILGYILNDKIDLNPNYYDIERVCKKIIKNVVDYQNYYKEVNNAISIFESCKNSWIEKYGDQYAYSIKDNPNFTKFIKAFIHGENLDNLKFDIIDEPIYYGTVIHAKEHYGFIGAKPDNVFFSKNDNPEINFDSIIRKNVSYQIFFDANNGKKKARNVTVVLSKKNHHHQ